MLAGRARRRLRDEGRSQTLRVLCASHADIEVANLTTPQWLVSGQCAGTDITEVATLCRIGQKAEDVLGGAEEVTQVGPAACMLPAEAAAPLRWQPATRKSLQAAVATGPVGAI